MGSRLIKTSSYISFNKREEGGRYSVTKMATSVLSNTIKNYDTSNIAYFITVTTCPDYIAPSLGQVLIASIDSVPRSVQILDLVQGCAGATNALILGSSLASTSGQEVIIVIADAALNGIDNVSPLNSVFSNGAFSCIIVPDDSGKGLLFKDHSYFESLVDIVKVPVGQNTAYDILAQPNIIHDPWTFLQLTVDSRQLVSFKNQAEPYILSLIERMPVKPDFAIFHTANKNVTSLLLKILDIHNIAMFDMFDEVKNCGASSVGVIIDKKYPLLHNKKVLICSFGTGGGINLGLWQM